MERTIKSMLPYPNDVKAKRAWQVYASSFHLGGEPFDCGRRLFPEAFDFEGSSKIEPLSVLAVKCLAKNYKIEPINTMNSVK